MTDEKKDNNQGKPGLTGRGTEKVIDKTGRMQSIDLKDYLEMKEKEKKRKARKLPFPVKITLLTPLVIVFCLGLYYIPYMMHLIATSPVEPAKEEKKKAKVSYDDLMKKKKR